jgi:hypothetical protein
MAEVQAKARSAGMSKEDEFLAYAAIVVLIAAIGFTIGAIFTGG